MDDLLLLVHRMPWPPNKGDKIRSHHLLRHLAARYRLHLGTFIDDLADERHIPELEALCASVYVARLEPRRARLKALSGLLTGAPLSRPYYRDGGLARWVAQRVREYGIRRAVVFSSTMAQYVEPFPDLRRIIDLVDVDSDKWRQYATSKNQPMRWIYAREARRLLAWERRMAADADATLLVSDAEAALFRELAPEASGRIHTMHNGVDTAFFDPAAANASPYSEGVKPLVFTGAMDYWPNEEAVTWFVGEVMPLLREQIAGACLYIVGNRPGPGVRALAEAKDVVVTGAVDDMRPWLGHAAVAVAPLRLARGVQNKVLEAMAMARPVVATNQALSGIRAEAGREVIQADDAPAFARAVAGQLQQPDDSLGARARERVVSDYDWSSCLGVIDPLLGNAVDTEKRHAE